MMPAAYVVEGVVNEEVMRAIIKTKSAQSHGDGIVHFHSIKQVCSQATRPCENYKDGNLIKEE